MINLLLENTALFIAVTVVVILLLAGLMSYFLRQKKHTGENNSEGEQVYIGNLSYRVRERHLREYFSQYGEITQLRIIKNHNTGRSKGFGFITYKSGSEANQSLVAHGHDFEGRALVVRLAKPR